MPKPGSRSPKARFALIWAAAGLLELPLLALMAGWPLPLPGWVGVLLHGAAAAAVFFAPPKEKGWLMPTRHWGQPLAALVLLAPGAGWLAAGWAALLHWEAPLAKDAYEFEDEGRPEDEEAAAGLVAAGLADAARRELDEALDVMPAVDALLSRDIALKRGAIETLARLRTPEAIGWLFKARADADPEVRFYATTALTRLKRDYELAIQAAERESHRRPSDLEAQLAVQRARYEYGSCGILEREARAAILEDCRTRLAALGDRAQEAVRLLYLVERELAPERAVAMLDELERREPEAIRWRRERARLLFSLGRHAELARFLGEKGGSLAAAGDRAPEAGEWRASDLWWKA